MRPSGKTWSFASQASSPGTWLADLGAREGLPLVLGPALSRNAIHGGQAPHAQIDAQKSAVFLRGGRLPQAYVYPADMRATRDRLRRRLHVMRQRAAGLGPIPPTHRQSNLPDMGTKLAYQANRDGVAARCADPAVHKRIDVDLALLGHEDELLRDIERSILKAAKPPAANPRSRLGTGPGMGESLRLVLRDELHDIPRVPRVQACVSSGRLVTCAKESAGQRDGTAGAKLGHASRTWAFSAAAVFCLRQNPPGQQWLGRLEKTPGQGQAWTGLAPQLARAVSPLFTRERACDRQPCLQSASGAARMRPGPNWPSLGGARSACAVVPLARRRERCGAHRPLPLSPALCWDLRSGSAPESAGRVRWTCAAPPPRLSRTGARLPFSRLLVEDGTRGQSRCSVAETTRRRLCPRRHWGECPARRVWCSRVGAPAHGTDDGPRGQRRTTRRLSHNGKKWKKSALQGSLSRDHRGPQTGSAQTLTATLYLSEKPIPPLLSHQRIFLRAQRGSFRSPPLEHCPRIMMP